jgi:Zn-dependent protease
VRLHASWFLILAIVTGSEGWKLHDEVGAPIALAAVAGLFGAILMFGSVLLHELGHCVLARAFGIRVRRIQLFVFGGVAEILGEPEGVFDEIVIAAAGPAVSVVLALAFLGLRLALHATLARGDAGVLLIVAGELALFLGFANASLCLFNLVPALPTDGGRIFRAILWGILGDHRRATAVAAGVGVAIAAVLVCGGLLLASTAGGLAGESGAAGVRIGGLWIAAIGAFLGRSALRANTHARIQARLRAGRVASVMMPVCAAVPAERTLFDVLTGAGGPSAAEMLLGFPVTEDGVLAGFVEPAQLYAVARERWNLIAVSEVMTPVASMPRVGAGDPLDVLVQEVVEEGAGGALVFDGETLVGYVGRADVARFVLETQPSVAIRR